MVGRVAAQAGAVSLSLLEVGAGSGDVPYAARLSLQKNGIRLETTLLDRARSHLARNGSRSVVGDALALPFADGSFDLVSCALFAHHLEPDDLVNFVNGALRVCRRAVLINDLVRSRLHLALVYAGLPLYRSRLTRHDGPASVRQAYTPAEMRALLERTVAARIETDRHYLCRMGVIAWKK
jgi:ubiquinone/menaquinone biosynthesis C-methylase UbiE